MAASHLIQNSCFLGPRKWRTFTWSSNPPGGSSTKSSILSIINPQLAINQQKYLSNCDHRAKSNSFHSLGLYHIPMIIDSQKYFSPNFITYKTGGWTQNECGIQWTLLVHVDLFSVYAITACLVHSLHHEFNHYGNLWPCEGVVTGLYRGLAHWWSDIQYTVHRWCWFSTENIPTFSRNTPIQPIYWQTLKILNLHLHNDVALYHKTW